MHLALLPRAAGAISSPWRMALTLAVSLGAIRMVQTVVEDAVSGATTGLPPFQLRVRLLWIRHGLSCANILNACAVGAGAKDVEELMPQLEAALHALPNYTWPAGEQCRLEKNYGLQPRPPEGKDCTVEVLQADSQRFVTKLHHLLLDPLLTDCSKRQSEEAGQALLHFLSKHGMRLHLIASSTLLRAIQTAYHMFVAPCVDGGSSCSVLATNLTVMPVPFVAERCKSKQPLQADNFAAPLPLQKELLAQYLKFVQLERFQDWPRLEQQFAKFKAFLALLLLPSLRIAETEQLERLPATLLHSLLEDPSATSFSELNWPGGSYREGPSFKRMEYDAMEAPEVVVALLGHGGMISKFCHLEASPQNNEVLEKLFIIETPTAGSTIMRELTGRCPTLMTAPQPELHHLSRADVDSCHVGFDVRQFLDLAKEGQCKASQSSYHFPFDSFDAVTLDI